MRRGFLAMGPASIAVVVVVALSLLALLAMARRKAWNADGSDDERRLAGDRDEQAWD